MDCVRVANIDNILDPVCEPEERDLHKGATVADYVPDGAVVSLNGKLLATNPADVLARPDDLIVSMPDIQGSRSDWHTVGQFIVVSSALVTGAAGFPTVSAFILGFGQRLNNYFFGPQPPKLPDDQFRSYAWGAQGNPTASHGFPRQIIYGKTRVKPVAIDRKTITVGKNSNLLALYGVADHYLDGLADANNQVLMNGHNVATAERGDVVVFSYSGVVDQDIGSDFKQAFIDSPQGAEVTDSIDLTVTDLESTDADGVQFDLVWPHGLFKVDDNGNIKQTECIVGLGYSTDSGSTWTWLSVLSDIDPGFNPAGATADIDGSSEPCMRFVAKKTQTYRFSVRVSDILGYTDNFQFRIVKISDDVEDTQRGSNVLIAENVSALVNGGYDYPGLATIGLIAQASDLSSGRTDVVVEATREYVYVYNANQSMWELRPANNPAWACYDILANGSGWHPMLDSPTDNLVTTNPGFEDGDKTGWSASPDGDADTSEVVDTESHHGDYSYHIIEDDNGNHGITQAVEMSAETSYRVSCWAKCTTQGGSMRIMAYYHDDSGYHYPQNQFTANSEWSYYSFSFTTGTGTIGSEKIYLAGRGEAYIDEVQMTEGTSYPAFPSNIRDGSRYGCGILPAEIDYDAFSAWASFCDTENFTVNRVFDTGTTAWEAVQEIARLGRGALYLKGSTYSVHYDDTGSASQLFTVGNILEDSFEVNWAEIENLADTIEVTYFDANAGYIRRTIIVHLPEWDASSGLTPLSITLPGCTNFEQAYEYGYYLLLCNSYQRRTVSFKADVDALACEVGDIIKIQHDAPEWGYGGRIKSVSVGATYITITLDQEIITTAGTTYEIEYRHSDDDTIEEAALQNVASETTDTVEILVSAVTTEPAEYDLFALGVKDSLYILYRIMSISRESDQVRKIEAQEYRTEVYGGPPTPDFSLTGADEFVPAFALRAVESHTLNQFGSPSYVTLAWRYVPGSGEPFWEILFRQIEDYTWRGQWVDGTTYSIGEAVVQVQSGDAEAYLCIQDHTPGATYDDEPGVGVDWEDFWVQIYEDYTWKGDIDGEWEDDVTYAKDDAVLISSTGYDDGPLAAFVSLGTADPGIINAPVLPFDSGVLFKPGRGSYVGSVNLEDWKYPEQFTTFGTQKFTNETEVQIEFPFIRDQVYEFTVRAVNERGTGQPLEDSPRVRLEISGGTYPEDVNFNNTACSFDDYVILAWDRASDPDIIAYEIRDEDDNWLSDDSHRYYYGTGLWAKFEYDSYSGTFYVRAVRQGNYVSENSDSVSLLTNDAPAQVSDVNIVSKFEVLQISWAALSDDDIIGYNVYLKESGGSYGDARFTKSPYIALDCDANTNYFVKIIGVDAYREGTPYESGSISTYGLRPNGGSTLPTNPDSGEIFLDDGVLKYFDGTDWQEISVEP